MLLRFSLAAIAVALVVALPANGEHCTTYSTSHPEVELQPFYIDNDLCQPECLFSIWFYEEINDIPGLQRGDEVVDDTCHGMIPHDIIAFY